MASWTPFETEEEVCKRETNTLEVAIFSNQNIIIQNLLMNEMIEWYDKMDFNHLISNIIKINLRKEKKDIKM